MEPNTDAEIVKPTLFFSVDIVNSASYKSLAADSWASDFKGFFAEFPKIYRANCKRVAVSGQDTIEIPPPSTWKALGDELLFFADINDAKEFEGKACDLVLLYTIAFRNSINCYNHSAHERLKKNEHAF